MERAQTLFGNYRRGDANDPERYVAAIAAVLALYDTSVQREVTDPRTGIHTTEKFRTWLPNVGELKAYCDSLVAHRARLQELGKFKTVFREADALPPPTQGSRATLFVPASNARYPALVEWARTAEIQLWKFGHGIESEQGIWISLARWSQRDGA